jgi:hypothetical protein
VLPTGASSTPIANLRFRSVRGVSERVELARVATSAYLRAR